MGLSKAPCSHELSGAGRMMAPTHGTFPMEYDCVSLLCQGKDIYLPHTEQTFNV